MFRKLAISLGIVDTPNQSHKTHAQPIPYLGGLSIVATVIVGLFLAILLKHGASADVSDLVILLIVPFILAIVGLIDDVRNLGALSRLLVQSISATVMALLFVEFGWFGMPSSSQVVNVLVSIFWVVGITNSINFIDNLDGGAGGIVALSATTLTVAALVCDQPALAALSGLIAGATLGFLVWNFYPAQIYLGDSGALFLGSLLALLAARFDPLTATDTSGWLFAVLLFAIPILDTTLVVISRIYRQLSPLQGGRDHISHRLLKAGLNRRVTALTLWTMQAYFSSLGLLLLVVESQLLSIIELIALTSWVLLLGRFLRLSPIEDHDSSANK